jgi:hypothetical protein
VRTAMLFRAKNSTGYHEGARRVRQYRARSISFTRLLPRAGEYVWIRLVWLGVSMAELCA